MSRTFWATLACVSALIFSLSISQRIIKDRQVESAILAESKADGQDAANDPAEEWVLGRDIDLVRDAKETIKPSWFDRTVSFMRMLTELCTAVATLLGAFKAITFKQSDEDGYGL